MENKISQLWSQIAEQPWFQSLKSKWEEIDQQSRTTIRIAGASISGIALLLLAVSSILSVRTLKKDLADKNDLIQLMRTSENELRALKSASTSTGGASDGGPWNTYFDATADRAGLDKTRLTVSEEKVVAEKSSGKDKSQDQAKESLMDLNLKKVNIKQLVRFAFNVENGTRPVKLRNLTIETQPDLSGYVDATLSVSAFTLSKQ